MSAREPDAEETALRHELSDVSVAPVLVAVLAVALTLAAVMAVLLPWRHAQHPGVSGPEAGPALLADPAANLSRYRAAQRQRLESYGWVDRQTGIAHVPVERAIEILTAHRSSGGQDGGRNSTEEGR